MALISNLLLLSIALATMVNCYELVPGFYSHTCPQAEEIVRKELEKAYYRETRIAASLLRLHFHDCFVNGCDGSILLDDTPTFTGEKMAAPNNRSARGFEVVDEIKGALERECHGVVSCADLLAIVARDSVVISGGPYWEVLLGRRDSLTASQAAANKSIPAPTLNVSGLVASFNAVGLSLLDMVTLSGAHTIGFARCFNIVQRLYNQSGTFRSDPTINPELLKDLLILCPRNGDPDTLSSLDIATPVKFDNHYFINLQQYNGILNSDEVLYTQVHKTQTIVNYFSSNPDAFFKHFVESIIKMGNIKPLTGDAGEIRFNCRAVNSHSY